MSFRGPEAQARQTWRTFLANHIRDLVSLDFFTVPTASLRVLFVLVVLAHHRRRVLRFDVTEHPTAVWTAQQIVETFPNESAPAYLLRDRDPVYSEAFRHRAHGMGIEEVLTAPHSPWQNPFAERLIGSVRRECLDHIVVFGEPHLRRILTAHARISRSTRTRPTGGPSKGRRPAGSWRFAKSVASTIDTSVEPRKPPADPTDPHATTRTVLSSRDHPP